MLNFKEFLKVTSNNILMVEGTTKPKLHLTHLEDLVIEEGKAGFEKYVQQVDSLLNYLRGLETETTVNLKVDGAPALYFGLDPRQIYQGQFFIAMKAAFAKDPKIMHSFEDIDMFYGGRGDLTDKLKASFTELKKAYDMSRDDRIFQGDLLFATAGDKTMEVIDGQSHLTFKPNTIKYAIPVDHKSSNYNLAKKASVGIFIHDSFRGKSVGEAMVVHPAGKDIDNLITAAEQTGVYIGSSTYDKVDIDLNTKDKLQIDHWLDLAKQYMAQVSDEFDDFYTSSKFMALFKMFLNNEVKKDPPNVYTKAVSANGEFDEDVFKRSFKEFLKQRYEKDIIGKKEKGIINAKKRLEEYEDILESDSLQNLAIATFYMIKIKGVFVKLFNKVESKIGKSFIQNPDGSWYSSPGEGFVLFIGDNQVKIVDRLDFSRANLTLGKFQK